MNVSIKKYLKETGLDISGTQFRAILDNILEELIKAIVEGNASLKMPGIGVLKVHLDKNPFDKLTLNRSESFKLRQKIIERGETPKKYLKDSKGNLVDNTGEDWLIYYINDTICRIIVGTHNPFSLGNKLIKYRPNKTIKRGVYDMIQSNPLKETFYETNNKRSNN